MRLPMTASKRRNQVGSSAFECGGRYRPPLCLCLGFPRLLTLNLKTFGFYIPITQFVRL